MTIAAAAMVSLACCAVCAPATVAGLAPQPARVVRVNGLPALNVDGAPFAILGAQCDIWRSTRQDAKTVAFFDGYKAMNATTVSVGVPWSKVEPREGAYDFTFVDWFIRHAEVRGLKLVVNLFNTNVCGKVAEMAPDGYFPQYTPGWILDHPVAYQRMVLPTTWKYAGGGPPMCPNDPRTLERERRYVIAVAKHLRETDRRRTVIMLQLNNEYYYQQWEGPRPAYGSPDEKAVRCVCSHCQAKWAAGTWKDGEDFMFRSFADAVKVLTDAITAEHPLPVYLNSPWWPPYVVPIFLERCPNVAFVGIDGVLTARDPNIFTLSQLGRNIAFAAECPTENAETRLNLDVLPYYGLLGPQGIGNLLWECGPPMTVVDDPAARRAYGDALYPLKNALAPIVRARGTDRLLGWYQVRELVQGFKTDASENAVEPSVRLLHTFLRTGAGSRTVEGDSFCAELGGLTLNVSGAPAGVVVRTGPGELIVAVPKGRIEVRGAEGLRADDGRFEGDRWRSAKPRAVEAASGAVVLDIAKPAVVRVRCRRG